MISQSQFKPPFWLSNNHLQTLLASFIGRNSSVTTHRERVELADGDFLDIDWLNHDTAEDCPTVIILHGLEGSIKSSYIQGLLSYFQHTSWRIGVMHFRGCSGEMNRYARSYHSGDTQDLHHVVKTLSKKGPISLVGFSLGGNVLLKYLGEQGAKSMVSSAVAVSVPFSLANAAERLDFGFSKLYRYNLMNDLKQKAKLKKAKHPEGKWPTDAELDSYRSFIEFDHGITAPLHGFESGQDYYDKCSCKQFLKSITTPTLIIHALDDPFMTEQAVPSELELSDAVELELSATGGHVGFLAVKGLFGVRRYLDARIPSWLETQLDVYVKPS